MALYAPKKLQLSLTQCPMMGGRSEKPQSYAKQQSKFSETDGVTARMQCRSSGHLTSFIDSNKETRTHSHGKGRNPELWEGHLIDKVREVRPSTRDASTETSSAFGRAVGQVTKRALSGVTTDGWMAAQGAWPIDGFQREKGGRLGRTEK